MSWCKTSVVAAALAMLVTSAARAEEPSAARNLKVENPTGYFSNEALQDLVYEMVSEDTRNHLLKGGDAVWVLTVRQSLKNGSNYCWAKVGLTEAAPKGRSARIPASHFAGAHQTTARGPLNDEQLKGCMSEATRTAMATFTKAGLQEQLRGIEQTRGKGARAKEPATPRNAHLSSEMLSPAGKAAIFEAIPLEFTTAFDYRRLAWVILSSSFRFDKQAVCFAFVGVSARSPDERWPRLPGGWTSSMWEMTPQESGQPEAEQRCRDTVALDAVKARLDQSWDDKGLLKDFQLTREDGLPLVNNYKPKKAPPAPDAASFRKSLHVGSDSHCGLVIEVKYPIAKVQSMIGETWLKVSQLYPKGGRDCRFLNGVYQDPN